MVRFEENKLIIEVETNNPIEYWSDLQNSLLYSMRWTTDENIHNNKFYRLPDFLIELQPDFGVMMKMIK